MILCKTTPTMISRDVESILSAAFYCSFAMAIPLAGSWLLSKGLPKFELEASAPFALLLAETTFQNPMLRRTLVSGSRRLVCAWAVLAVKSYLKTMLWPLSLSIDVLVRAIGSLNRLNKLTYRSEFFMSGMRTAISFCYLNGLGASTSIRGRAFFIILLVSVTYITLLRIPRSLVAFLCRWISMVGCSNVVQQTLYRYYRPLETISCCKHSSRVFIVRN